MLKLNETPRYEGNIGRSIYQGVINTLYHLTELVIEAWSTYRVN